MWCTLIEDQNYSSDAVYGGLLTALSYALLCKQWPSQHACSNAHLALFIKGHDNNSSAMAFDCGSMLPESLFTFLHGDGVDDALALAALQAGLHYEELGGVNHEGHLADLRV